MPSANPRPPTPSALRGFVYGPGRGVGAGGGFGFLTNFTTGDFFGAVLGARGGMSRWASKQANGVMTNKSEATCDSGQAGKSWKSGHD